MGEKMNDAHAMLLQGMYEKNSGRAGSFVYATLDYLSNWPLVWYVFEAGTPWYRMMREYEKMYTNMKYTSYREDYVFNMMVEEGFVTTPRK